MRKRRDCANGRPDINRIFFNGLAAERIMAMPNVSRHLAVTWGERVEADG